MDAKEYIENKKNRFINSDKEILDGYAGAIDRLQKAFPRYGSFLMEFVQNADDAKSTTLRIELTNNNIVISNNGEPFNESNVDSICKAGRSSKTPKDYIGYLWSISELSLNFFKQVVTEPTDALSPSAISFDVCHLPLCLLRKS